MLRLIAAALALLPFAAAAECTGQNLIDALPAEERATLDAAVAARPYSTGNFWQATRGPDQITLVGTYHQDDPRHADTLAWLEPVLANAKTLLVEAGPDERAALTERLGNDPGLLISTGPTLPELLPRDQWQALSAAFSARGIPPVMGAKFRPWYVTALLATPPCSGMDAAANLGLDGAIIDAATTRNIPIQALEPYDTIFGLFDSMTTEEQIAMVEAALTTESQSADYAVTLADAYFAGQSAMVWEMSRIEAMNTPGVDSQILAQGFDKMEQTLVTARNRAWIPVITGAAAKGPIVAAFGALHLPGENGVLNLLAQEGFTITPVTP